MNHNRDAADSERSIDEISGFAGLFNVAGRSSFLLMALLALLILYPFSPYGTDKLTFGIVNSAVLISGVYAVSQSRRAVLFAIMLAVPTLGLQWLHISGADDPINLLFGASLAAFYLFTIAHVLSYVLSGGAVTADKLHAAVSAYILTALLWMSFYGVVDGLVPGSFLVDGRIADDGSLTWRDYLFFSFTTLTSTGYGDIVPASRHAQSFAILEQLSGTFFVAILIARLAGLYRPQSRRR